MGILQFFPYTDDMPTPTAKSPAAPLLVLDKLTGILDAFTPEEPFLSLAELRKRTDLPASTAQRLVSNLTAMNLLELDERGYRVGSRIRGWAATSPTGDNDIIVRAQPLLERLRDRHGEAACIYRREDTLRVCVALADTRHTLRIAMWPGRLIPLPAGAAGRVLTAWDPQATAHALASNPDAAARTEQILAETRSQGWAISTGERETGATGIAIPLPDRSGGAPTLALGMQGPSVRVDEQRCLSWLPDLEDAVRALSSPS